MTPCRMVNVNGLFERQAIYVLPLVQVYLFDVLGQGHLFPHLIYRPPRVWANDTIRRQSIVFLESLRRDVGGLVESIIDFQFKANFLQKML